ncbi:Gldg family protein [Lutibacter aestuarii]|uniref:Gldg family protein n=1 Tax=Lutibacter aestuarii TaxID=861111 RepID=A0ABW2Z5X0_9FLAO
MRKIFKIAKVELNILFYSPIAWLILIIFILQCGVAFTNIIDSKEMSQQLGNNLKNLTISIFGGNKGFFASVQDKLYLYIPLLTMGLMSREISSGSIKLLFSSPLTSKQIILGKFLSMMLYGLLLVMVLFLIVIIASFSIENLDYKYLLGGILGLYILICTYSSIGLFMSSLTSYQVVAAISTLAVLAALNFIGSVGQSIDFVRDITYWVSISGRSDNFINGLISSKDLIYFGLIISLFLFFTVMRFDKGRKQIKLPNLIIKYTVIVLVVLGVGYISSLPTFDMYYDTTRYKKKTLTKNTQLLISKLKEPIKITTYVNVINGYSHLGSPKFRIFDLNKFDDFTRFIPDLEMNYVTYYDSTFTRRDGQFKTLEEFAKRSSVAQGFDFDKVLKPSEIKKQIDLKDENNFFVRKVAYKGKTTSLRMFYDMIGYPEEAEIAAAIKRLLQTPPKIGFLSGNVERRITKTGDKEYKDIINTPTSRRSLINQGFDVLSINLNTDAKELDSISVLVVADPIVPYSELQLQKINEYIRAGGNIIIAGEPKKRGILNPILKTLGLKFSDGILLQESEKFELDLIQATATKESKDFGFTLNSDDIISFSGAMGILKIEDSLFNFKPILKTDSTKVWNKLEAINLQTDTLKFNPDIERKLEIPVAVALTRTIENKLQKIMVIGDADFMSNKELGRFNLSTKNTQFTTEMFKWFSDNEFPVNTSRPEPNDNKIIINQKNIKNIRLLFIAILPILLGVFCIVLLIKRKRQ